MGDFNFPVLTSKDLAENIQDMIPHESFNVDDFKNPQTNKMQVLYPCLLGRVLSRDMKTMSQSQLQALQSVTNSDLLANNTTLIHFVLAMQRVLRACSVTDFTVQDLRQPKPKRTRRFLSALINFLKFQDQRLITFEMVKEEINAAHQQYAGQMKRINDLKERINNIKASRAEEEAQLNQLRTCIEEENSVMTNNQRFQQETQKVIQQSKTTFAEQNARLDQLKVSCLNSCEAEEELRKQVVQSPERMKADIHRMHAALAARKQTKVDKSQRLQEIRSQNEQGATLAESIEHGINLLQASNVEVEKQKNVQAQIEKKRDDYQEKKDVLRDVKNKIDHMTRQKEIKQDKLAKLQLQHQYSVTSLHENIEQGDKHVTELASKQEKKYGQVVTVRDSYAMLEKQLDEKEKLHGEGMLEMKEKYTQLLCAVDTYHKNLAVTWEKNDPQKKFANHKS